GPPSPTEDGARPADGPNGGMFVQGKLLLLEPADLFYGDSVWRGFSQDVDRAARGGPFIFIYWGYVDNDSQLLDYRGQVPVSEMAGEVSVKRRKTGASPRRPDSSMFTKAPAPIMDSGAGCGAAPSMVNFSAKLSEPVKRNPRSGESDGSS